MKKESNIIENNNDGKSASDKNDAEKDFHLNKEFSDELIDETVYSEEYQIGKIFGAKEKKTNKDFIQATSRYTYNKKKWGTHSGFKFTSRDHVNSFISALRKIAHFLGWIKKDEEDNIESLKQKLREKEEQIVHAEQENKEAREEHDRLIEKYKQLSQESLKLKYNDFKTAIKDLEEKIKKAQFSKDEEKDMQEFLYTNCWLFGTEYIDVKPQKMPDAHSKFDFYLERFNKTNDIVEIKLISDTIINQDKSINAKVIQAIDQIIEYMELTIAVAHSVPLSEEEGIKELRPRGIIIIGNDTSKDAIEKIKKWNYQLSKIQIMTYSDVLLKGKAIIRSIEKEDDKIKNETN